MIFSVYEIMLLFFIYSFLGWCVEVAFVAVTTGKVVNRGFLNGPVCPIYGCGMVGVLIILLPVKNNVWLLFLGGMIICSTVELFGGWILDKIFHMRWWDYSDKPFNIGGYICLPFSIMWGFAVVFAVKFVHTPIMFLVKKVPDIGKLVLIIFFVIIFTVDMIVTLKNLIGIKKSLGQLDLIAEELNNIGNQIKDVVGNSAIDMADKAEQAKEEKNVLCGCDYLLYQAYATGAIGWISMTANILPKLSADFHNAMIVEKDYQKGLEIYKKLYPVVNMTERYPAPTQAVKHILSEVIGFDEGICRRPRREISDEDKKLVVEWSQIKELAKTNKM